MKTLIYRHDKEFAVELIKYGAGDVKLLCPRCRSELLYAPDSATAAKLKVHPGIYCPKNWQHVCVTYSLRNAPPAKSIDSEADPTAEREGPSQRDQVA